MLVLGTFLTALPASRIVASIIRRAKKRAPTHRLALQMLDPSSELRILLCVQGPQNAPASINLVEITKGTADTGIVVYVTDMIELTAELSDSLERDEALQTATVKDRAVMERRDQVTNSFQAYVADNDDGITLKRTMTLSTITNMPQDIFILAEDLMIALIILPFHRSQREDKRLDSGNPGFRYVNRKVTMSAQLEPQYTFDTVNKKKTEDCLNSGIGHSNKHQILIKLHWPDIFSYYIPILSVLKFRQSSNFS